MSRRQHRFILAPASLAFAVGIACAAQAPHNAAAGPSHVAKVADLLGRADFGSGGGGGNGGDCGNGGDGGKGGDSGKGGGPGQSGEPGKPGAHGCTRFEDLPDKPKEKLTLADKVRIVMVVLHGPTTSAEAAKKYTMSAHEIDTWKRQYLAGDWTALMGKDSPS
ncbi:DUF1153 domain-containing protein [Streptomyces sp. NPDC048479]|uniref:DUF1153 domain-containing protein n=1 Tax=Streptomyces sp. NPDC048479 TaxID=3154725 RepID=UPI003443808E